MPGGPTKPAQVPLPVDEALATLAHELRHRLAAILLALDLHPGDGGGSRDGRLLPWLVRRLPHQRCPARRKPV